METLDVPLPLFDCDCDTVIDWLGDSEGLLEVLEVDVIEGLFVTDEDWVAEVVRLCEDEPLLLIVPVLLEVMNWLAL